MKLEPDSAKVIILKNFGSYVLILSPFLVYLTLKSKLCNACAKKKDLDPHLMVVKAMKSY